MNEISELWKIFNYFKHKHTGHRIHIYLNDKAIIKDRICVTYCVPMCVCVCVCRFAKLTICFHSRIYFELSHGKMSHNKRYWNKNDLNSN